MPDCDTSTSPDEGLNTDGVEGLFCSVQCVRFYQALARNNKLALLPVNQQGQGADENQSQNQKPDVSIMF